MVTARGKGISNNCQCNSLVVSFLTAFAMEKNRNQKTKSDPQKTKSWAPHIVPKWLTQVLAFAIGMRTHMKLVTLGV